jgi:hypothetical protein
MEEFLNLYEQHKNKIEDFLQESLHNLGTLKHHKAYRFKKLFTIFPSLELIYITNTTNKIQTSANFYRYKTDKTQVNKDREYLLGKLHFRDKNIAFSNAYISSATRNSCITVSIKEGNDIIFLDFKLESLLESLDLIQLHRPFHTLTKSFYAIAGFAMVLLSLSIIIYSMGGFFNSMFIESNFSLDAIFKPIIALTLGIAIFDLAKTILEQEVFFKSYSRNSKVETKMITKFLITIIIALSIEALMVVFKIAMENYDKMINALYLIIGVSSIIVALSAFIYLTSKKSK